MTVFLSTVFPGLISADIVSLFSPSSCPLSAFDTFLMPVTKSGHKSSNSLVVWVATNPLHPIPVGQKFIFQTNCSTSDASSMYPISFLFIRLIQHHFPRPSKLCKADRRPSWVLDRGAKSNTESDSPFGDCQLVACNVSWHFHNPSALLKGPYFYFG